ncbi:MAG: ABC transporter permease [Oscillospiraceae bacterium]|nr:ABC transporter permease [Oscillospiraceae bacterium]
MSEEKDIKKAPDSEQEYSLNDDRRVKVLSPGAMVAKRFFRNRLAVVGLVMLAFMFLFSFLGGLLMPYGEGEQFYTVEILQKDYVNATQNNDFRLSVADGQEVGAVLSTYINKAAIEAAETFSYKDVNYTNVAEGNDTYSVYQGDTLLAVCSKDIIYTADGLAEPSFNVKYGALVANAKGGGTFTADGKEYTVDEDGNLLQGDTEIAIISRFVVVSTASDIVITRDFREKLEEALVNEDGSLNKEGEFVYTGDDGVENIYDIIYDPAFEVWAIKQGTPTDVFDTYSYPTLQHPLGTDKNGMDIITRLMYGGRVSLIIGFIVVFIETFLGVIMGGIAGYFGGWVDNLIMRLVDIFYCIPSMPILIILGSVMDSLNMDPQVRMMLMMLILGFLGWAGIARLVRGQILSLREQEFMTATEACGIRASRRIFRHLIPNVIPQLIVTCTMGLGSTIIMEATLSFLGLGVKFPFASWGNIISDVNDSYVMTTYWFVWIPAGICLLVAVLGFNFVGDGLRDAFDPRMKR